MNTDLGLEKRAGRKRKTDQRKQKDTKTDENKTDSQTKFWNTTLKTSDNAM